VIWAGPVSSSNLRGALLPVPAKIVTVNQGAGGKIGSSAFAALGRNLGSARELLARHSVDLDACETLTLAGFSAAHGLLEVLLRDPETLSRTDALLSADAYYTSPTKGVKPGYLAMAQKAAARRAVAVFTSSPIAGPGYPSGIDSIAPLMREVGVSPILPPPPTTPPPVHALGAGSLWWLQYSRGFGHGAHATRLARQLINLRIGPALERAAAPGDDDALAAAGAAALLLLATS
jgi:hypothetical protein